MRRKEKRRSAKAQQRAEIRRSRGQGERLNAINEPVILRPALKRQSRWSTDSEEAGGYNYNADNYDLFYLSQPSLSRSPSLETSRRFFPLLIFGPVALASSTRM